MMDAMAAASAREGSGSPNRRLRRHVGGAAETAGQRAVANGRRSDGIIILRPISQQRVRLKADPRTDLGTWRPAL
jgi:hypothetical protein